MHSYIGVKKTTVGSG